MDDIPSRVRRFLVEQQLFTPRTLLVVAVSGGPDSLCLLHVLHGLMAAGGPRLHVAHLDHRFRGAASAAEAAFVAATAAALGLPATIEQREVARLGYGRNRQAAARAARYAFLHEVAHHTGAQAIATGHQLNDQAETVLLHLLRGAGPAGLRGMLPLRQKAKGKRQPLSALAPVSDDEPNSAFCLLPFTLIVRPLLATPRAAIDAYCREHGLQPCDDPSNRAERYARSRIRARLLPALARENPQIVAALGRTAQICADDYDFIQGQLDLVWPALAEERRSLPVPWVGDEAPATTGQGRMTTGQWPQPHAPRPTPGISDPAQLTSGGPLPTPQSSILLRAAVWAALHPSLQRYALRRAVAMLDPGYEPSYEQVETARTLAAAQAHTAQIGSRKAAKAQRSPGGTPSLAARSPYVNGIPSSAALGPRLLAEAIPEGLLIRRRDAPIITDLPQIGEDMVVRLPPLPQRPSPPVPLSRTRERGTGGEGQGAAPSAIHRLTAQALDPPLEAQQERGAGAEGLPGFEGSAHLPIAPGWACVIQAAPPDQPSRWWVRLDRAALGAGLVWRTRRAGDRFRPAGGRGSRKIQDFLVDVKLPRHLRDAWPILATEAAIVWVAGLRADERFVAGPASQDTIWVGLVQM